MNLIRPDDFFYLLEDYTLKYGDPKSLANRKRGRRIKSINGYKGVAVPGDAGQPWKLQRLHGTGVEREDEQDVGSGSEADPEIADNKEACLRQQQEDEYSSAVAGLIHNVLLQQAQQQEQETFMKAKSPGKPKEARILDPAVIASEEPRVHSSLAIHSDSDDGGANRKPRKIAKASASRRAGSGAGSGPASSAGTSSATTAASRLASAQALLASAVAVSSVKA